MELTKEQQADFMECLLKTGEILLESGAEISRVEDTISRIAAAYGTRHVDVFVITSLISLTLEFSGTDFVSETRRIYSSSGRDFYKLEKLNELSREVCAAPVPIEELRKSLDEIALLHKPFWLILTGSMLAAGSFAIFFGGSIFDGFISSLAAIEICMLQRYLNATKINIASSNLLVSFLTGLGAAILCKFLTELHMDKILIGDIMLLIPGLAMTNAVRNILVGNTLSGVLRLIESLIWAGAVAGGFMTSMIVINTLL